MATTPIPVAGSNVQADTTASANSVALRDGSGGLTVVQLTAATVAATGKVLDPITTITSSGALGTHGTVLCDATSGAIVPTLPAAASSTGQILTIKKIDSSGNAVTVTGNGAELIDGANTKVLSAQWASIQIQSSGTAWYILAKN